MTDYLAKARQYETDVLSGAISACKWVRLACERNQRDLKRAESAQSWAYVFRAEKAIPICRMAEMLPHIKGPKAFITGTDDQGRHTWNCIELEPWQCWVLTTLFGWVHRETGLRRFRVGLVLVPRKNAKSTLGAIIVLYMLTADGESGAECYSAATTRDQAKVVAEIAWEMAKRSPLFREFYGVRMGSETSKTLMVPVSANKFAPLSADAHSLDGLNVSLAIVDELHAHKTRGVWDVLDTATGARQQPLLMGITTAGVEIGGICHEKLGYLEKVLSGAVDDEAFFGLNYTVDEGDDWRDQSSHQKANPNYGVSVQPDDLIRKVKEAEHSPAAVNNFLTKHLNVWVRSESAWMTADVWQSCTDKALTLERLKSYPCWIGVDLADVRDFCALVALFKVGPDRYAMIPRLYLPEETLARSPIAQLSGWVREKWIIETDGNQSDLKRVEDDILQWVDTLDVQEIDFDRALASQMIRSLKDRLEPRMGRDAVDRFVVVIEQKTEVMDAAMKMVERLVLRKGLTHNGNKAFAWMISNVVVDRNQKDELYPRKAGGKDSPNKIDGPMALFDALSAAMTVQAQPMYRVTVI